VILAGLLAAAPALAAPRGAALLPLLKPAGAPELRDRFHESVTRGLQSAGLEVIPAAEIRMRLGVSDEMMTCSGTGPCAARVGLLLRTDVLIAAEIDVAGKDYAIKLRALDAAGREVGRLDDSCDICTLNEADQAVTRAVAKLASQPRIGEAQPPPPPPPVHTEQLPPPPPTHVEPPPPVQTRVEPPPTPPPPVVTPPATPPAHVEAKPFPLKLVLGIGSGVVGIVFLSVGSYLVSIDGQPTCSLPDPVHHCPNVYSTVGGGGALIAFGIAGLAGAGALIYLEYRAPKPQRAQIGIVPAPGGAMATLGGRF
jgi:hypothetical protein